MSYSSVQQASTDIDLVHRVEAAASREAWLGAGSTTGYAAQVRSSSSYGAQTMIWPVALDTEAAYESALAAEHPRPGFDPSVISDQMILSAVQAHWPADLEP